jgi:riboflavin biosynthesis pyrimidine reductase
VDELHLFQAPVLLGSAALPMAELPLVLLADALRLQPQSRRQVGRDQYLVFRPAPPGEG